MAGMTLNVNVNVNDCTKIVGFQKGATFKYLR